jgi:hypothetical protein
MPKVPIEVLLDAWYLKYAEKEYVVPPGGTGMDDLEKRMFEHLVTCSPEVPKSQMRVITRFYPAYMLESKMDDKHIYTMRVQLREDQIGNR